MKIRMMDYGYTDLKYAFDVKKECGYASNTIGYPHRNIGWQYTLYA